MIERVLLVQEVWYTAHAVSWCVGGVEETRKEAQRMRVLGGEARTSLRRAARAAEL
jgi:hypothetical protein